MEVTLKKYLGQHFLKDLNIARRIADSLEIKVPTSIGSGTGNGCTHSIPIAKSIN